MFRLKRVDKRQIIMSLAHGRIEPVLYKATLARIAGFAALFFFSATIFAHADQACRVEALTNYND
jgi:hypothetical protein